MVLISKNVAEDRDLRPFLDQPHGDPCHTGAQGDTRAEKGEAASTDSGHGAGAVALEDVGFDPYGIGKGLEAGEDGEECAPGQVAVANLATARATEGAGLSHREGREIVVQEKTALLSPEEAFEALKVPRGPQGAGAGGLRLAAGEEGGAVWTFEPLRFSPDGSNFIGFASIHPGLGLGELGAKDFLLKLGEKVRRGIHLLLGGAPLLELCQELVENGGTFGLAGGFILELLGFDKLGFTRLPEVLLIFLWNGRGRKDLLLLSHRFPPSGDVALEFFQCFGGLHEVVEEGVLGDILSAAFDHDDPLGTDGDDQVRRGTLTFCENWEDDGLVPRKGASAADNGAVEGNAGDMEGSTCSQEGKTYGIPSFMGGEDHGHDLDFALEAFGEKGADRAVDDPAGEDFLVGDATFSAEEVAGDTPSGSHLFAVFHGEWEEVYPWALVSCGDYCDEDAGFSVADEDGGVSLASDLAGFEADGVSPDFEFEDGGFNGVHGGKASSLCSRKPVLGFCV